MGALIEMQGASALLQELYESDIDASLTSVARQGFIAEIGRNGEVIDSVHVDSYREACEWLLKAAVRLYPASRFAMMRGGGAKVITLPLARQQLSLSS